MSAGALAELARAVESGGLHCPLTIEHPLARAAEIPAELALRAGVRVILVVDDVPAWVAAPGAADVEVKLDGRPRRREAAVSTGWQYVSLAYADDEE